MIVAFNEVSAAEASTFDTANAVLPALLLRIFACCERSSVAWGSMFHWTDGEFTGHLAELLTEHPLRLRIVAGDKDVEIEVEIQEFFDAFVERGGVFQKRPFDKRRNHDKWFLFEKLNWEELAGTLPAGARLVGDLPPSPSPALCISTGNLTGGDRDKNNAAVVIPVSTKLADAMRSRFGMLHLIYRLPTAVQVFLEPLFAGLFPFVEVEDDRFKLYLFPRLDGEDTVERIIGNIDEGAPSSVRISNNRWSRSNVSQALKDLHAQGQATIAIVARGPDDWSDLDGDGHFTTREMSPAVEEDLRACSTRHWQRHKFDDTGAIVTRTVEDEEGEPMEIPRTVVSIHSKYLTVDANYMSQGSHKPQRNVWVGSPNMTKGANNKSFEVLVKIKNDPAVHEAFLANFDFLRDEATDPALPPGTA